MSEILDLTPGLQCCLRCGRLLTDRALHDALEEPVLASIRAEHPEWTRPDEVCQPCIGQYRRLLDERQTRSERLLEAQQSRRPSWMSRWLDRQVGAQQAF
ncbi:MAG TPA: hypothetical protein VF553_18505 [Pyrinomonadaceae bacterium]|jgi:hypothetical protein